MADSDPPKTYVRSKHNFKGKNNDELCFRKNDVITITQMPDGGWWEGTLGEKTGWFPSNYVVPIQEAERLLRGKSPGGPRAAELALPAAPAATSSNKSLYRDIVLKDLIEAERAHVKELQSLFADVLAPMGKSEVLNDKEYGHLIGNFEEVVGLQIELMKALEKNMEIKPGDQRIGGLFMEMAPTFKALLAAYCQNHPLAIEVINQKRPKIIESLSEKGIQLKIIISGLSQPFRHIQKYPSTLQELERNMEENNPDKGDTQRAASVYRDISNQCSELRKQKEMQLELLNGLMEGWEGEPMDSLGNIIRTGSVGVQEGEERSERCLVLFPSLLVFLETAHNFTSYLFKDVMAEEDSTRLSAMCPCFQKKVPVAGLSVRKPEAAETEGEAALVLSPAAPSNASSFSLFFPDQDELSRWLEAFQTVKGIVFDDSCTVISPTEPSKYKTVQGDLSPCVKPEVSVMPGPDQASLIKKTSALSSSAKFNHDLQMIDPGSDFPVPSPDPLRPPAASAALHRPLPTPKLWSKYSLMPHPAPRGNYVYDPQKNDIKMRKRGQQPSDNEDAQVLKVVEAYCTSAMMKHTTHADSPQLLVAEDEKIIVEEIIGDEIVIQEKSLVDTVYALKDQVDSMQKDMKHLIRIVEKEQKARKRLEEIVRRNSQIGPRMTNGITAAGQEESPPR